MFPENALEIDMDEIIDSFGFRTGMDIMEDPFFHAGVPEFFAASKASPSKKDSDPPKRN